MRASLKFRITNKHANRRPIHGLSSSKAYCPIAFPNSKDPWAIGFPLVDEKGNTTFYKGFDGLEYKLIDKIEKRINDEPEMVTIDMLVRLNGQDYYIDSKKVVIR